MGARILVVDDEPDIREVIAEAIETEGHAVTTVGDAVAALDRLAAESYDVVITDLVMPGMSGLDVAEAVKRTRPRTAVILITAWKDTADRACVGASPVDATLAKPIDIRELRGTIAAMLRSARATPVSLPAEARILLLHDGTADLDSTLAALKTTGVRLDTARSPRHALALACARPYDLIIVDGATELEAAPLAAALRVSEGVNALVPLLAVVDDDERATRDRWLAAGMADVVTRSGGAETLAAAVRRCVRAIAILDRRVAGSLEIDRDEFLGRAGEAIAALRLAAERADADALAGTARALQDDCTAIGATAMLEVCREIQRLGQAESVVGTLALVERLACELTRARWALQRVELHALIGRRQ